MEDKTAPQAAEPAAPQAPAAPAKPASEISCMNVMQRLVEDKVDKYMKMSKMCTCLRCRTDVVALALSNLPPKYVVMENKDLIPMTALFEGRFNTAVVAQIMSACAKVKQCPRHDL